MNRRSVFKALAAAPIAAKQAMETAAAAVEGAGVTLPPVSPDDVFAVAGKSISEGPRSPFAKTLSRIRRQHWNRMNADRAIGSPNANETVPYQISTKKSWSPAFKAYAMKQQLDAQDRWETLFDRWSPEAGERTDDEIAASLMKAGLGHLLK